MKLFRSLFFWIHLAAGLIAGLSIAIMCFTGATLAFEKQLVAWSERDSRQVAPPAADAPRLPLADLTRRVRDFDPEARPTSVTVSADPHAAVAFALGRDRTVYADPFTGQVRAPASTRMHDFLHLMEDWHRALALGGDRRPLGKAINGAGNLAFLFLAVSGLYLWWPRSWSRRGVKAIAVLNLRATGKARDFNWHNTIGLWSAPVLIVLTLTAIPMSYRWGNALLYRLVGDAAPAPPGPGGPATANPPAVSFDLSRPTPDARPLGYDAVLARVQTDFPRWEQISFRSGNAPRSPRTATADTTSNPAAASRPESSARRDSRPAREAPRGEASRAESRGPQPLTVTIRESGSWPRTATTTLTLNPFTGEVLRRETLADLSPGRRLRGWTRFLHTGEALGVLGQLVAGLACLGGCFLVYTGVALSYRRFFGRPAKSPAPAT